jgi:hypothetical protein
MLKSALQAAKRLEEKTINRKQTIGVSNFNFMTLISYLKV